MNVAIANSIRDKLKNLEWMDVLTGMVRAYVTTEQLLIDGRPVAVRKAFPVSCEKTDEQCRNNYNWDLIPDDSRRSITYFEDNGSSYQGMEGGMRLWQSQLTMVVWVNMKRFEFTGCSITPLLIGSVLDLINNRPYNLEEEGIAGLQISVLGELPKNANIFSKWSYREEQNQYLLFPYDYFALSIRTSFRTTGGGCASAIILKSNEDCP